MTGPAPFRATPRARRAVAALVCAAALLALSVLVYSPLHKDNPQQAKGVCPFCQFQHLAAEPTGSQTVALVQLRTVGALHLAPPEWHTRLLQCPHSGRAPPTTTPAA